MGSGGQTTMVSLGTILLVLKCLIHRLRKNCRIIFLVCINYNSWALFLLNLRLLLWFCFLNLVTSKNTSLSLVFWILLELELFLEILMSLNYINDLVKGWPLTFVELKTVYEHIFNHLILYLLIYKPLNGCVPIKLAIKDIMFGLVSLLPLKRMDLFLSIGKTGSNRNSKRQPSGWRTASQESALVTSNSHGLRNFLS